MPHPVLLLKFAILSIIIIALKIYNYCLTQYSMCTCIKALTYLNATKRFPKCSYYVILADPPGLPRDIKKLIVGKNVLTTRSEVNLQLLVQSKMRTNPLPLARPAVSYSLPPLFRTIACPLAWPTTSYHSYNTCIFIYSKYKESLFDSQYKTP